MCLEKCFHNLSLLCVVLCLLYEKIGYLAT